MKDSQLSQQNVLPIIKTPDLQNLPMNNSINQQNLGEKGTPNVMGLRVNLISPDTKKIPNQPSPMIYFPTIQNSQPQQANIPQKPESQQFPTIQNSQPQQVNIPQKPESQQLKPSQPISEKTNQNFNPKITQNEQNPKDFPVNLPPQQNLGNPPRKSIQPRLQQIRSSSKNMIPNPQSTTANPHKLDPDDELIGEGDIELLQQKGEAPVKDNPITQPENSFFAYSKRK